MQESKTLVFFGSGPVAADSLAAISQRFKIEAVVTKAKPEHHKGGAPVIELAKEKGLPVFFASDKNQLLKLFKARGFFSEAGLVVDYGVIIPKKIIDFFPHGIANSHFSLLPEWRGADPITFALLSGQKKTGVSLMLIEPSLDTGKLIAQADYDIDPDENIFSLTRNLTDLSVKLIDNVLPLYLEGKVKPIPQGSQLAVSYSRQLTKSDGSIDWQKPAQQIEREVRAFLGWPRSRAEVFGRNIIITKARLATDMDDGDLVMKCSPGYLEIQELIGPSGRRMTGADFIRGYRRSGRAG